MGVPKFFRWLSERYPAISQLIAENRIPEFDCLYLDMNGIIHNCTHSESDSPTFRMTEDKMFIQIFNYIEHLYGKIRPKQLFFMAIDGVAPRAKMNQQRARRFRTALDAEVAKEKAIREGAQMPAEAAFDSNCITPGNVHQRKLPLEGHCLLKQGTEFMAKLTKQLKYFINKKISEDADWQGVDIVLSGHEVPGEGEHKIMEYIRLAKAQPDYDPNVRHCLYGLDADLIMLGLLSHDPHFCLLREEVTFGRQSQKKSKELEHQNFFLMHLCIVREYLELEFQELQQPSTLNFPFDMERVIDDFILMAFFVGNDFLPNLPNLHINEGALALMFKVYKSVLPKAGGYINEGGVINLHRLALLLEDLSDVEYRFFESENSDAKWFKGKQMGKVDVMEKGKRRGPLTVTTNQKTIFKDVKQYVNSRPGAGGTAQTSLDLPSTLNAQDRKFVEQLADDLGLSWKTVADENGNRLMRLDFPQRLQGDGEDDDEDDEESQLALLRIVKRYDNAKVVDLTAEDVQMQMEQKYEHEFQGWKDKYYKSKFKWGLENEVEMRKLTENYIQGLQWVLFYYYRGVASWPWFYGYHYSPMISDVKKGLGADMNFRLGQPFRPYQQLMGVLPDRSKRIVPTSYHDLMTNPDSPIIDFYPRDFELDMNGKKMEWEAVVKIPFIDEKRLLDAMKTKEHLLSQDERDRNDFGVTLKFTYSPDTDFVYHSSLPGVFPELGHCHCVENIFELPTIEGLGFRVGLMADVKLGEDALAGFPSLKTLSHTGTLGFHGVNVFQQDSRNESMVITMMDSEKRAKVEAAKKKMGKRVYVSYPFLSEARVIRVSDELFTYSLPEDAYGNTNGTPLAVPHGPQEIDMWRRKAERIEAVYSKRLGMVIGPVETLIHVDMLKGLKKTDEGASIKEFAQLPGLEVDYASQMVVEEVVSEDQRFLEKSALPVEEEFPVNSGAFFMGEYNYGRPVHVIGHSAGKVDIWVSPQQGILGDFGRAIVAQSDRLTPYTPSFAVARMLGLNPLVLSKITSAFQVIVDDNKVNVGLNLKFEAKGLKVLGYSRKAASGWEFSQKAIHLLRQYMVKFPDFIAGILRNPQSREYVATDFYPKDQAKAKMKEIQAWLKEIESKSFEKVPLDAAQLDSDAVGRIEAAANDNLRQNSAATVKNQKIKGVPRSALLKPSDAEHRLNHQKFTLGDRVVYVQDSGRVPIATQGTVVGMTRTSRTTLVDVIFDVTFMSGTSLEDRCSPFRGSTVPIHSVLNLTDRQVVAGSRAAESHRPLRVAQPPTANGHGAPSRLNGQGQLLPAQVPGPLTGSFRGAVSGQQGLPRANLSTQTSLRGRGGPASTALQNQEQHSLAIRNGPSPQANSFRFRGSSTNGVRGRGRGNPTLQHVLPNGYVKVDQGSDDEVVKSRRFPIQSYSNVPPPANLDSRGRGRGRVGPRGGVFSGDNARSRGSARGSAGAPVQQQ
ncbi:MAG: hypothetical protein LQ348_000619 [Seirophora lacunosa]|nr:MAG: hypothetical protein LQ348_000619 [Seirophora lacunosa]